MARSSIRRGPSHINSLAHNFLGLTLFVSSLIVAAITFFFIYHLTHDNWPLPWTFILVCPSSACMAQLTHPPLPCKDETHPITRLTIHHLQTAAVALLTVALVPLSALIHCCHTPNPTHQVILSAALLLGWTVSFALLSWNASATITTACNVARWGEEGRGGHMICRIYKAQYAFALFALYVRLSLATLDAADRQLWLTTKQSERSRNIHPRPNRT